MIINREQFVQLGGQYSVVPVAIELMADMETPVGVFDRLVGAENGFLLETVEQGGRWGRYSFVGMAPQATIVSKGGQISLSGELPGGVPDHKGILDLIDRLLVRYRAPEIDELPPFHGGIVGYIGYDVVREVERLPDPPEDDLELPDAVLFLGSTMAAFDHWKQRLFLIEGVHIDLQTDLEEQFDLAQRRLLAAADRLGRPHQNALLPPPEAKDLEIVNRLGPNGVGVESPLEQRLGVKCQTESSLYRRAVQVAREYILDGDIFQVVLSQRFDLHLEAEAFDLYRSLRLVNPSPHMYLFRCDDVSLVGSSPEPLVQLLDNKVISRPIAGTRRRGRSDADDRRLGAELKEHPKERAEHVMLVDLARNDVGRVVKYGTERVEELMTLELYSHVMHLTSEVTGELREGASPIDVLRATLPAGTVSGAPKVRAMQIIDELEPSRRGPYAGVIGYFDFSGNLDTAIAIRTMVVRPDGRASVQAGAGVVIDSDPAEEDLECHNKAAALLAAVPGARRIAEQRREHDQKLY